MANVQPINTLLGPGTKRAAGSPDQIQAQIRNTDFDLAREQWGFDSCRAEWMDAAIEKAAVSSEHSVLVPCAGQGGLADRLAQKLGQNGYRVLEVQEREAQLRDLLSLKGYRLAGLFDLLSIQGTDLYDRILVFPPHHQGREADYLRQCYRMLAPGGRLVAIVADSIFFHSRKESYELRRLFRALRRMGRAGYEKLEDEDEELQPGEEGQNAGQPEDGKQGKAQPQPDEEKDDEDEEGEKSKPPANRPPDRNGSSVKAGPPGDEDGDGGRAFELGSPFFSQPLPSANSSHRPNPYQGRYWRLVWMDRGEEKYADEAFDDHTPFAPDDDPLSLPRMRSLSIKPQGSFRPALPKPQGGLLPSSPAQLPRNSQRPEDAEAELELELELIKMRVGISTLAGLPIKRRLNLAKARLKLR